MDADAIEAQLAAHRTTGRVCVTCGPVAGKRCRRWADAHAWKVTAHLTAPLPPPEPGHDDAPRPQPEGQEQGDDVLGNEPGS